LQYKKIIVKNERFGSFVELIGRLFENACFITTTLSTFFFNFRLSLYPYFRDIEEESNKD